MHSATHIKNYTEMVNGRMMSAVPVSHRLASPFISPGRTENVNRTRTSTPPNTLSSPILYAP